MSELSYTLLSDGSSDRMLMPALDWLLRAHADRPCAGKWADLGRFPRPPKPLGEQIKFALDHFPCDLLFVHRDAEKATPSARLAEIEAALGADVTVASVPVLPVRMQEAWFLFDEAKIREAAGNPAGGLDLSLPRLMCVERLPDPKAVLDEALRSASELRGRRRATMKLGQAKHRLATLITDFSPLRTVPAFASLENTLAKVLHANGWSRRS